MTQRDINIPNLLTLFRVLFVPFFVYLIFQPSKVCRMIAFGVFAFASLTDLVDGYLARRLNQETEFGKFLDPLADKCLVLGAFITFVFLSEQIQVWMVLCILARDVMITLFRYLAIYQGKTLRTSRLAKLKTAFQMFSIIVIVMSFMVITVPQRDFINQAYHNALEAGLSRWDVAASGLKSFLKGEYKDWFFGLASFLPYYLMILTTIITAMSFFRYLFTNYELLRGPIPVIRPKNKGKLQSEGGFLKKGTGFLTMLITAGVMLHPSDGRSETDVWRKLAEGLYWGQFAPAKGLGGSDLPVEILRIDTNFCFLKLLCASEHGGRTRTARQWCEEFRLEAAINASMYQNEEPLKSTGYMRNYGHVNNSHFNPTFGAFMAFNPTVPGLPAVQIIDRHVHIDWMERIKKYHTVVQNYRMISDGNKTGWQQQGKIYRNASIGMDKDHNVLFILGVTPASTHDFIHTLLSLPIGIRDAMYVEGGAEATLHIRSADTGSHPLPNVIGISKRR